MKWWKVTGVVVLLACTVGGFFAYRYYQALTLPNVRHTGSQILYIYPGDSPDAVKDSLEKYLISAETFERAAQVMKFDVKNIRSGRYDLSQTETNRSLINMLRGGHQAPVNVVIHNERDIPAVAGKISRYLMLDSLKILDCLAGSPMLNENGFDEANLISLIIPNTYQMYWNTDCETLARRFLKEYNRFWNQERRALADSLNMTPAEVYTLASIVDRETIAPREKPTVAGVYLNRLKRGMLLQADPTVVFANNILDTRRVLFRHLEIDSPYNTYKYAGLPPGPIGIASINGIDAVLHHENHDFLYMVAKPDNTGLHNFSADIRTHNRYARQYQSWLNQRGL